METLILPKLYMFWVVNIWVFMFEFSHFTFVKGWFDVFFSWFQVFKVEWAKKRQKGIKTEQNEESLQKSTFSRREKPSGLPIWFSRRESYIWHRETSICNFRAAKIGFAPRKLFFKKSWFLARKGRYRSLKKKRGFGRFSRHEDLYGSFL